MSDAAEVADHAAGAPISLGIDLGTSAVKAVAIDLNGALIAESGAPFPTMSDRPLQAEQAPADWLRATGDALQSLAAAMHRVHGPDWAAQVAAIGVTGQLPTLVCLSDAGPVAPAITWKDGRADAWVAARVDTARRAAMYARTGMPIDGRYLAPMLQFHFSGRLAGLRRVLSAKDYLLSVLTGLELTEPSTAAGYGLYDLQERRFSDALGEFWDFPRALLPEIRPANSAAGPLNAAGAALLGLPEGIRVSTGAADSVCAAFAMSGLDPRTVSVSFGSSAVIIGTVGDACLDAGARYLVTPHVAAGWFGREMDLLATGTGYRWLCELFGWDDGRIDAEAALSVPGANGLLFPPYLAGGEQGALWNPRLQAGLFGLTVRHTRADIARAYLEGVFFEIKRCVDVLAETSPVDGIRVSGNLVASPPTLQLLADILGRPVGITEHRSPAAVGVARLARPVPAAPVSRGASANSLSTHPDHGVSRLYAEIYGDYLARSALCD